MADQGGLPGIDNPAPEVISQRDFAKLVQVSSPAITKAIATGRLSAACVAKTRQGKQLYKDIAFAEWVQSHPEDATSESEIAQSDIAVSQSLEGSA
ncbi:MAG: hypothetical protein ACYC0V_21520, partial [Armatimonadota bacterium]